VTGPLRKDNRDENERFRGAYRDASCFCLLSEFDAFPNVVLEAQYAGIPVVALDRQSRREAVVPDQTGILVAEARADHVAEAIIRILADPAQARAMGQRAQGFIRSRFTWPAVAGKILEHIRAALAAQAT
jgi:glycosyltransferase involved in cell wall biosynthesis